MRVNPRELDIALVVMGNNLRDLRFPNIASVVEEGVKELREIIHSAQQQIHQAYHHGYPADCALTTCRMCLEALP